MSTGTTATLTRVRMVGNVSTYDERDFVKPPSSRHYGTSAVMVNDIRTH